MRYLRTKLDAGLLRQVAVLAGVDPRTVARRICGEPTRHVAGGRTDAALVALGLAVIEPGDPPLPVFAAGAPLRARPRGRSKNGS